MKSIWDNKKLVEALKTGGVAVMPTDTIYGIVGRAQDQDTVERIYKIRQRNPDKPCIVLIGDVSDLGKFSIELSEKQKEEIKKYWPIDATDGSLQPTSIVFDCVDEKLSYLHRGTNTLAFRLSKQTDLQNLLKKTGPLIAPSANLEKFPASKNIWDAKKYFCDQVDLYVDGGTVEGEPSKVIKLSKGGDVTMLRG